MGAVAELRTRILGDATGFNRAVDGAKAKAQGFETTMASVSGKLARLFSVGAAIHFGARFIKELGDINDAAQDLNITTDALQALRYAAVGTRVNADQLAMALQHLKVAQGEVADSGKLQLAFKALGVSLRDVMSESPEDLLAQLGRGFLAAKNETEAYNAVVDIFGGKVGPRMIGVLKEVAGDGLQPYIDKVKEAGAITDKTTIEMADKFDTFFQRLALKAKAMLASPEFWKAFTGQTMMEDLGISPESGAGPRRRGGPDAARHPPSPKEVRSGGGGQATKPVGSSTGFDPFAEVTQNDIAAGWWVNFEYQQEKRQKALAIRANTTKQIADLRSGRTDPGGTRSWGVDEYAKIGGQIGSGVNPAVRIADKTLAVQEAIKRINEDMAKDLQKISSALESE